MKRQKTGTVDSIWPEVQNRVVWESFQ